MIQTRNSGMFTSTWKSPKLSGSQRQRSMLATMSSLVVAAAIERGDGRRAEHAIGGEAEALLEGLDRVEQRLVVGDVDLASVAPSGISGAATPRRWRSSGTRSSSMPSLSVLPSGDGDSARRPAVVEFGERRLEAAGIRGASGSRSRRIWSGVSDAASLSSISASLMRLGVMVRSLLTAVGAMRPP